MKKILLSVLMLAIYGCGQNAKQSECNKPCGKAQAPVCKEKGQPCQTKAPTCPTKAHAAKPQAAVTPAPSAKALPPIIVYDTFAADKQTKKTIVFTQIFDEKASKGLAQSVERALAPFGAVKKGSKHGPKPAPNAAKPFNIVGFESFVPGTKEKAAVVLVQIFDEKVGAEQVAALQKALAPYGAIKKVMPAKAAPGKPAK